ncbi:MAG: hypothetical protein PHY59_01015 [Methanobacterium sp.]|nr:hypothetical protein [Methanobacterium sp.]
MAEQETVKCGRCDTWFKQEKEKNLNIKKQGKVKEYLCPECDEGIKKGD